MTTVLERRIDALARARGISFNEAARVIGRRARRRKSERTRDAERLTRVRRTWAWARDFEL